MSEQQPLELDEEVMIAEIVQQTGVQAAIVRKVIDAEFDYMVKVGIIQTNPDYNPDEV